LIAEFKQLIAPLVILSLGDLVFRAKLEDFNLAGKALENNLEFLLAGPLTTFYGLTPFGANTNLNCPVR